MLEDERKSRKSSARSLTAWQYQICAILYLSYAACYFGKLSVSGLTNQIISDPEGLSMEQVGVIGSSSAIGYSIGKIIATVVLDMFPTTTVFSLIVLSVGLVNLLFSVTYHYPSLVILWGINGALQGLSWSPVARLITEWYEPRHRGRWWGFISTCSTVSGAMSQVGYPLMCGWIQHWRVVIQLVSLFPIAVSMVAYALLKPTPASAGFRSYNSTSSGKSKATQVLPIKIRLKMVLLNPGVQMLSIACMFIYIIRTGMSNWGSLYLHSEKGFSQITAGSAMFWMEIGGAIGSATGGWVSDSLFHGRRGPINALFSFLSAVVILGFSFPQTSLGTSVWIFLFGYCLYIPQTFLGMHVIEIIDSRAAGSAIGYIGLLAGIGSVLAGYPLGKVARLAGWNSFYYVFVGCASVAGLCIIPYCKNLPKTSPV